MSGTDESIDDASLNGFENDTEIQSIALLRQIFPDEPTEELRRLHRQRLTTNNNRKHQIRLGDRMSHQLPEDFLRLPLDIAVRRFSEATGRWSYEIISQLQSQALDQYARFHGEESIKPNRCFTKVLFRDLDLGLGLTLYEEYGIVRVHSLSSRDGQQWFTSPKPALEKTSRDSLGPALDAGVEPGDVLIGINGSALIESMSPDDTMLRHSVKTIRESPDPVVLHFQRIPTAQHTPPSVISLRLDSTPSLLDTTLVDSIIDESPTSVELSFHNAVIFHSTPTLERHSPTIHSFAATLASRGIISSTEEKLSTSRQLAQFTTRTRQWEATSSFTINSDQPDSQAFIPLIGVRKALSVRVVNFFTDRNETAYTIWVYDVECGKEWYAPVRYFRDFQELRAATVPLHPSVQQIPFPKQPLNIFGSPIRTDSSSEREFKCRQLESFLRSLCTMIYRAKLYPGAAELAIHVQSFLGCEAVLGDIRFVEEAEKVNELTQQQRMIRLQLKRSIQRFTYRLLLLDIMCVIVNNFVDNVRSKGPRWDEIESLEAQGRTQLKTRAMKDLEQIQTFLDFIQDLVVDGCSEDFRSISEREEYVALDELLSSKQGEAFWDRLIREAVREQIEIEVYVPLRGVVSRWLVNGWRHEDMEVQFKIKELRKRSQSFFRINEKVKSPTDWISVSSILREGVGQNTLPCAKLRAIVDAAREVSRLFQSEHDVNDSSEDLISPSPELDAEAFLPIFIFCVVQAEMERPCALCVLLRTLCDSINKIGEIGYYLTSFEAAIAHIQEVDLTQDPDRMLSFLSVPLNDN